MGIYTGVSRFMETSYITSKPFTPNVHIAGFSRIAEARRRDAARQFPGSSGIN